jgi:hypothetical protein
VKTPAGALLIHLLLGPFSALPALGGATPGIPEIGVQLSGTPAPGYIFLSNFSFSRESENVPFLLVLDNSGRPAQCRELEAPLNLDFKVQPDGSLTYCDGVRFFVLDETLAPVDTFQAGNGCTTDPHELRILPNGRALLLGRKTRVADMTPYGGRPNAALIDLVIQEVDRQGTVHWEWDASEHFTVSDATRDTDLTKAVVDWAHCNAIEVDSDGNLLLSSRHLDEITKIDRATGDIIWRLGGAECRNNEFTFLDDFLVEGSDTLFFGFSHQHGVRRLANGHILLFDNGNLKEGQFSRAVEYELDETSLTARRVWEYRNTPDIYSSEMGFAQRLPNGNTLIGWGGNEEGRAVTEVAQDGTKLFELRFPEDIVSYRAFRFVFGSAVVTDTIGAPGLYEYNQPGVETGVALVVPGPEGIGEVTIERHFLGPNKPAFAGEEEPDTVYSVRWTVTGAGLEGSASSIRFDLAALPEIGSPGTARVYARELEGVGSFTPLATTYSVDTQSLEALSAGEGEYAIGAFLPTGGGAGGVLALGQNLPNPFNEETTIRFRLGAEGEVSLRVYDVFGREVATLLDGPTAAGSHETTLDASRLPSGVYLYRLRSSAHEETRKMVLVR